jgi:hypothetical protein
MGLDAAGAKAVPVDVPELICYAVKLDPPKIVPARAERDWMSVSPIAASRWRSPTRPDGNYSAPSHSRHGGMVAIQKTASRSSLRAMGGRSEGLQAPISATVC